MLAQARLRAAFGSRGRVGRGAGVEREPVLADMAAREEGGLLPLAGLAVLAGAAAGLICAIFRLVLDAAEDRKSVV